MSLRIDTTHAKALPGLEGAPRTGKRRGQARTSEDEKERKVRHIYRLKAKEKKENLTTKDTNKKRLPLRKA
ncbi:MAG TPA: hypothetical protein QF625_00805 [Candidatus Scalindua sp.]|nr:hypothetical protein [Candidatus Scalindua sp.]